MESRLRVLLLCTGNTCRSPMAEALLKAELGVDAARVEVMSAGLRAAEGDPAAPFSFEVASRHGIDLGAHRSRRATPELIAGSDLVLVMEPSHLVEVRAMGAAADTCHVMSEWPPPGEPDLGVSDPYGGSREGYEECWRRIAHHVKRIAPHIIEALRSQSK